MNDEDMRCYYHDSWQSGSEWLSTAKVLKTAADKILKDYLAAYQRYDSQVRIALNGTPVDLAPSLHDPDLTLWPVYKLLMGYALENLLKGIIISKGLLEYPRCFEVDDFSQLHVPRKNHIQCMRIDKHLGHLLSARAIDMFDNEEEEVIEDLDNAVKSAGRYPVSKKYDPKDPLCLLAKTEPIKETEPIINAIYQKAEAILERLSPSSSKEYSVLVQAERQNSN